MGLLFGQLSRVPHPAGSSARRFGAHLPIFFFQTGKVTEAGAGPAPPKPENPAETTGERRETRTGTRTGAHTQAGPERTQNRRGPPRRRGQGDGEAKETTNTHGRPHRKERSRPKTAKRRGGAPPPPRSRTAGRQGAREGKATGGRAQRAKKRGRPAPDEAPNTHPHTLAQKKRRNPRRDELTVASPRFPKTSGGRG